MTGLSTIRIGGTMPIKDYDKRIKREIEKLENNKDVSEDNKKLLMKFDRYLRLNDYSKARRTKLMNKLRLIAEKNDINYIDATKEDIEDIVLWLKDRCDITETTKLDYRIVLKRFYRWLGDGEYPDCVKWINTTDKNKNNKLPEDMLNEDDVLRMIKSADCSRDKAFISVLWETGARIGELIDLTVGDLQDHDRGLQIVVKGKTGARRLLLIESIPHIREYLKDRPDKDNPNAPLWINIKSHKGKKTTYRGLTKILKETGNKAGINKPLNPHHFRHSRATYLANKFTESQMCQWFGWKQGSKMIAKYVHMSGRDVDTTYARIHGIEDDKEQISKMSPKNCPRCDETISPVDKFCSRCGLALTIESTKEIEEKSATLTDAFMELAKENPQLLELLTEQLNRAKGNNKNLND